MSRRDALSRTLLLARDLVGVEHSDDDIVSALQATTVSIVADAANLSSIAGQSAAATLATLVMQLGCPVRLLFGEVALLGHQPPLAGRYLGAALIELAADSLPGEALVSAPTPRADDLVFVLGDTKWTGSSRRSWRLVGDGWRGGTSSARECGGRWSADIPIGALAAAAIAAAEVFKAAIRPLVADPVRDQVASLERATVRLGDQRFDAASYNIGAIDCVSAGAITQAFAHSLFRVPGVRGALRAIEPDLFSLTNLNRYALGRRSQLGWPKAAMIRAYAPEGVDVIDIQQRVDADGLRQFGPLSSDVVVGTDNIPSRWFVQRCNPRWLAIGATTHFLAVTSEHDAGLACARCMHPRDDGVNDDIPTISFTSYWAGLMLTARLLRRAAALRCDASEQAIWLHSLNLATAAAQHRHRVRRSAGCDCGASTACAK